MAYFNGTYVDTSRVEIDFAKGQGDTSIPQAWSRHTKGSSAYKMTHKDAEVVKKREKKQADKEIEDKKQKFREFLKVMEGGSKQKQSWNDSFQEFMMKKEVPQKRQKVEEAEEEKVSEEKGEEPASEEVENWRLYVMNLPFTVTHEELQELFGKFGEITKVEIPLRKGGKGAALGIAYITFKLTESAISAYAELDKQLFQGRKLHILPAEKKPPQEERPPMNWDDRKEAAGGQKESEFKKEKERILKTNFDDETNWNYLFMNQDTVATSMAKRLDVDKGSLLDKYQSSMAVKLAKSEAIIINQTKEWMKEIGIDVDALEGTDRKQCQRSRTTLLVKNIPYTTKEKDLREIFERYGELQRIEISPFNTLAVVEYVSAMQAQAAAKNLAYYKVNYIMPIYLEFAPQGILEKKQAQGKPDSGSDSEAAPDEGVERRSKTVFIKNLNFNSTETQIEHVFQSAMPTAKVLSVKIVRRPDNQQSKGFGFVEMGSVAEAEKAVKKLQNFMLDDHSLKLSLAQRSETMEDQQNEVKKNKLLKKRKQQTELSVVENETAQSNKLLVKNLAFEATPADVKELF